ncbi:MAG: dTDP-glucose 4,6-dehydratase [Bacteroidetes bacterium]|nr:dTDP-glucose 4,6-dehydratase [Bacteroidota bacterium]
MRILVTGGAGFIGANFIHFILKKVSGVDIVNFDKLTYAGNLENLTEFEKNPRYTFVKGDILNAEQVDHTISKYEIDGIIHFAAESHVDRSILGPLVFTETNVIGTQVLLEAARKHKIKRYLQISTDEVYGSLGAEGLFHETTPLAPNSPYSASKASADMLVRAYVHTFDLPAVMTRCSNNYGPYQFPEKLIPLMIINALNNKPLPVYGDGMNVRDWIHVEDHNRGVWDVFEKGKIGEHYNLGGIAEKPNIEIVKFILNHLGKDESQIKYVKDRPGHDKRYAMDVSYIKQELGWEPKIKFEEGLASTIDWYLANKTWWERILSGDYQNYFQANYKDRV